MVHPPNRRGIIAMVLAAAFFSFMDSGLKLLSPHYPALEVAALRSLASLPLVVPYALVRRGRRAIFPVRWPLHLFRAALGIATLALFTVAVRGLPLSEAYAIFFVAPTLITILSGLVLHERVSRARWIAILVGLTGVLIVLRPTGHGVLAWSGLAALAAAALYAVAAIVVRILGRTDSSESLVLWSMATMAAGALVVAAPHWVAVRGEHAAILAGIAVSGFFGQIAITEAFRRSEASAVAPFEYTALAWGVALDWGLWRVLPDRATLLGAAVIVGSGVYLARQEKVHAAAEHP